MKFNSTHNYSQHCHKIRNIRRVIRGAQCNGKPMILKPSCSWCKDFTLFERNGHLAILVMCFAKICEFISKSPIMEHIKHHEEEQKVDQDVQGGPNESVEKNGKMLSKKKSKGKRRVYPGPRRRYKQLTFSLSHVLNDGLAIKTDLMDWLDKKVSESTDTTDLTPTFLKVQSELCLDTNALLLSSLEENNLDDFHEEI
ncbi:uncharacterized protein LOC120327906 isoform X2 [Styela clava]|uniref:uncharacterized protein LOC120327906 isoform X2 n=1 Tax=Styela clava TaxID=7725 RepID=UPI001939E471|nr:uncharacterized protein LOC120327906 isoform X2 [Styela clava]XP_039250207.1 uncharacterized protein LOC120327906 isoform X2 [Styela clava]XP_039250325.1 uncharacterized protein LOC120328017 isoform X2 [Styela clava]XP_039250326.1 uncharacterized protein LOC120328017 isoform X2 [Styela clava]